MGASAPAGGALFGLAVWGVSLVQLPALRLAPPVWRYRPRELAVDVPYHSCTGSRPRAPTGCFRRGRKRSAAGVRGGRGALRIGAGRERQIFDARLTSL
jgi:hypothetical protein